MTTEEILIKLGLDASSVKKGTQMLLAEQRGAANSVKSIWAGIGNFLGGAAVLGGLNKILNKFDDIQDKADNLTISTDFLQGMEQIAGKNLVGGKETFDKGIRDLQGTLGEAKGGDKQSVEKFQKLGISMAEVSRMDAEQMFYRIADALNAIPDPAKRSAAAFDILGKSGKNMAGFMGQGSEEIRKAVDAVDKLDSKKVKDLADAKDQIEDVTNVATVAAGKTIGLVADFAGFLGKLSLGPTNLAKSQWEMHRQNVERMKSDEQRLSDQKKAAKEEEIELERKLNAEKKNALRTELTAKANALLPKIRDLQTKITAHNFEGPTIEELAGRDWSASWKGMYSEGGQFDVGKGTGRLNLVAKEFIKAREAQRYARAYGTEEQARSAQERMNKAESILANYGATTPQMDIAGMRRDLGEMLKQFQNLSVTIKGTK